MIAGYDLGISLHSRLEYVGKEAVMAISAHFYQNRKKIFSASIQEISANVSLVKTCGHGPLNSKEGKKS